MTKKNRFETFFVNFRTSSAFVLSVIIFIMFWMFWNMIPGLPHFDNPEHFGHLNLLLSIEATVATVLLMRDNERSRMREMNIIADVHTSRASLSQIERDLDEIQEDVEDIGDRIGGLGEKDAL